MKTNYLFLAIGTLLVAALACNAPSVTATPVAAFTPTMPSGGPIPTFPGPTLVPGANTNQPPTLVPGASGPPMATALNKDVVCRFGPGTEWAPAGTVSVGQSAAILTRNADGSWLNIENPSWLPNAQQNPGLSSLCWVPVSETSTSYDVPNLGVNGPLPAFVTKVTAQVQPNKVSLYCGRLQNVGAVLKLSGTIETNGPALVDWYFAADQGNPITNQQSVQFDSFGSKDFSADYTAPATQGNFLVSLETKSPDGMIVRAFANYEIDCQ